MYAAYYAQLHDNLSKKTLKLRLRQWCCRRSLRTKNRTITTRSQLHATRRLKCFFIGKFIISMSELNAFKFNQVFVYRRMRVKWVGVMMNGNLKSYLCVRYIVIFITYLFIFCYLEDILRKAESIYNKFWLFLHHRMV